MSFYVPPNQTVCWSVYNQNIVNTTRLPDDFLRTQTKRISRAFDAGEPIWMICDELKMIYDTRPSLPTKTPLQLAKRIVRI